LLKRESLSRPNANTRAVFLYLSIWNELRSFSEKLEYRPGRLFVNVYKRPKYVSPNSMVSEDLGVITAPMPDQPIERCKADVGLLSQIIVSKFADHLPLYRQDGILACRRQV